MTTVSASLWLFVCQWGCSASLCHSVPLCDDFVSLYSYLVSLYLLTGFVLCSQL